MTSHINPTVDFGTAGVTAAEISSEDVRVLLRQIEAELHQSEVYRIALQSLKKTLGEAANKAEIVVRAVGREAIQLSIKQLIRRHRMMVRTAAAQSAIAPDSTPEPEAVSPTPPPSGPNRRNGSGKIACVNSGKPSKTPGKPVLCPCDNCTTKPSSPSASCKPWKRDVWTASRKISICGGSSAAWETPWDSTGRRWRLPCRLRAPTATRFLPGPR